MPMPDVPILGQTAGSKPQLRQHRYAAEITTVSGARHRIEFSFDIPVDPAGNVDLGPLKDFDPEGSVHAAMNKTVSQAAADPVLFAQNRAVVAKHNNGHAEQQPVSVRDIDGAHIAWRHVESWRYLGPADEVDNDPDTFDFRP